MLKSTFNQKCKACGFVKKGSIYVRCIGDGIIQTIQYGKRRKYIDPKSPYYSNERDKSNYLIIGLMSMYGTYSERCFNPKETYGQFTPANFRGRKFIRFMGIEDDWNFMIEEGFSILDSIQTHDKLAEVVESLYVAEYGSIDPAGLDLSEEYLKCGRVYDALVSTGAYYAGHWAMFHERADRMPTGEYLAKELEKREATKDIAILWSMIARCDYDGLEEYLRRNFERNVSYAKKYGLPLPCDEKGNISPEWRLQERGWLSDLVLRKNLAKNGISSTGRSL